MNVFIKKCIRFLFFHTIGLMVFFCFFSIAPILFNKNYKINSTTSRILIGDSHIENSFNDAMSENYINLAHYAESYYFSYPKLKIILSSNSQIKKVYLGYSYHNLSNYYNDYISGIYSQSISSKYFFTLSPKQQLNCMYWNIETLSHVMRQSFKYGIENLTNDEGYSFKGGYSNRRISSVSEVSVNKRINGQFYLNGKLREFSSINLEYLDRIINLCELKNVELVLLTTPLHEYYKKNIPIEYLNKYNEIVLNNGLTLLDFSDLKMEYDCYLPDGDHVTEKGAIYMTKYFLIGEGY